MSRVIKNEQMMFSPPIIIDLFASVRGKGNKTLEDNKENINLLLEEKRELERVKKERNQILQDTEKMVMELLEKARGQARDIIADAHKEAEIIKLQASEEATRIKQETWQEAYKEGIEQARAEMETEKQKLLQQQQEILEEARQTKIRMLHSCEADMVQLVLTIARKVIAGELHTNPDVIVNVLREAINYLDRPEKIIVYLCPEDLEKVSKVIDEGKLIPNGNGELKIDLKPDERLAKGGVLLESDAGTVDAQLDTRIASVFSAVQEQAVDVNEH